VVFFSSKYSLFYAIFSLLMLIHYGFCSTDVFFNIKYSYIWKITNIFVKQYKKRKRAGPDLEPVEFLSTGLNRPVEIFDLTVKNRLVQIQHWTGEKPVRLIYQKWCFISSDPILIFFLFLPYSIVEIYWTYIFEK
jgi:hypothetical protein